MKMVKKADSKRTVMLGGQILACEQHLRDRLIERRKEVVVHTHQAALSVCVCRVGG